MLGFLPEPARVATTWGLSYFFDAEWGHFLGWLGRLASHGGAAVDIFFVLSGLVILRSLQAFRGDGRGFLIARAARIFPVYLLALGLALALRPFAHGVAMMHWIGPDSPALVLVSDGWRMPTSRISLPVWLVAARHQLMSSPALNVLFAVVQ